MDLDTGTTMDPGNLTGNFSYGSRLAPIRDHLYIVIPMTVAYALIFLSGVVGNVVTCLVIARNKHMHTATNYYLFSLACSDLLLLVSGLPQEMYIIWFRYPYIFGEAFCLLRGLAAETSANATVLTITAFTVERYVAICHPFLSHTMSRLSRAVRLVLVIWLFALGFAIPQALQFGVVETDAPEHLLCMVKRKIMTHSFEISTFLFFVAPMTLITVLYVLIGLRLRSSHSSNEAFCKVEPQRKTERRKTIPMVQLQTMRTDKRPTVPLVQVQRPTIVQLSDLRRQKLQPCDMRLPSGREKAASMNGRNTSYRHNTSPASRRVLKMLVAVVVAFFICWAPFHAQRLVAIYGTDPDRPPSPVMLRIYGIVTYISGILYYVSTTINPILYHIMSLKFREAFKDSMGRCLGLRERRSRRPSYSSLCRLKSSTVGRPRAYSAGVTSRTMMSAPRDTSASDSLDTSIELREELNAYMQTRSRTPSLK